MCFKVQRPDCSSSVGQIHNGLPGRWCPDLRDAAGRGCLREFEHEKPGCKGREAQRRAGHR